MKLTTEPGALAAAVRFTARALTARTAYPILGGLKITASDDDGQDDDAGPAYRHLLMPIRSAG